MMNIQQLARAFQLLSDVETLKVIEALDKSNNEGITAVSRKLGMSQPLVSVRVQNLRKVGLVVKVGHKRQPAIYHANDAKINEAFQSFRALAGVLQ